LHVPLIPGSAANVVLCIWKFCVLRQTIPLSHLSPSTVIHPLLDNIPICCILYSNQDEEDQDSAVGEEEGKDAGIRGDEEDLDPTTIHSLPLPCKSDLLFPFALWTLSRKIKKNIGNI